MIVFNMDVQDGGNYLPKLMDHFLSSIKKK